MPDGSPLCRTDFASAHLPSRSFGRSGIAHHLAGRPLGAEAMLVEFAAATERHRIEALLLPLRHGAVSSVSAAATGEAGGGPTRAPPTVSTTTARTTLTLQPPVSVAQWDTRRRLAYVLPKAAEDVPGEALRSIILGLATPEGLAALVLVVGLEVASHAAGGLWTVCGVSAFYAMIAFRDFLIHTIEARTDRDLDVAGARSRGRGGVAGDGGTDVPGRLGQGEDDCGRVGGGEAGNASETSAGRSSGERHTDKAPSAREDRRSDVGAEEEPELPPGRAPDLDRTITRAENSFKAAGMRQSALMPASSWFGSQTPTCLSIRAKYSLRAWVCLAILVWRH
jgi:hypothetical protein